MARVFVEAKEAEVLWVMACEAVWVIDVGDATLKDDHFLSAAP